MTEPIKGETSDGVRRLHVPIIEQDQDGTWFSFCHACSHEQGNYSPRCKLLPDDAPWPPFNLSEDVRPVLITPEYVKDLNELHNPRETPDDLIDDIVRIIARYIEDRPRSKQKMIGPSEIGHDCGRFIAYKLIEDGPFNETPGFAKPKWRPQVGIFAHDGLADIFERASRDYLERERFLVERLVKVAEMQRGDDTVSVLGTGDLYDAITGSVVDWKIVGPTTLKKVKARVRVCHYPECEGLDPCPHKGFQRGASKPYRKQGQTYARGFAALGLNVNWVIIVFLPASGELTEAYFHIEPYDPQLADEGIDRMIGTQSLLNALSAETVLGMMPTADAYCEGCDYYNPDSETLAGGCPGHEGRKQRADSLLALIPPPEIDDGSARHSLAPLRGNLFDDSTFGPPPLPAYDITTLNVIPVNELIPYVDSDQPYVVYSPPELPKRRPS